MRVTESGESGRESSRKKVKSTEREIIRDNKYKIKREIEEFILTGIWDTNQTNIRYKFEFKLEPPLFSTLRRFRTRFLTLI